MIDWGQWRNEPAVVAGLVIVGWIYGILAGPLRAWLAPGEAFPRVEALRFYAGLALFYLAVDSPFGRVASGYLFSALMTQELVIMYPAAALVLLGLPHWMIDAALARPALGKLTRRLLRPTICGAIFVLVVTGWHMPRPLEWALESPGAHALQHASLFVVSLVFWWPLTDATRVHRPLSFAGRMVYLFAIEVALTALFTYLLMADHAIYPSYQFAPRLLEGVSAVDDQVLGGTLLSAVSSLVLLLALGISFRSWAHRDSAPG